MIRFALLVTTILALGLAATPIVSAPEEVRLPVRSPRKYEFTLTKLPPKGSAVILEFDARIDLKTGFGGYHAKALLAYVNGKLVKSDNCLNLPMEFQFINGHTGEPGRWTPPKVNFESIKTGIAYEDDVLKHGGNYYALVYASNFEDIDTPKNKYSSKECSRCHFVMDITSMCREGKNTLVL